MTIEHNIPLPVMNSKEESIPSILKRMKAGDSVVVNHQLVGSWYPAAAKLAVKIAVRKIQGTDQSRVWRIA